MDVNFPCALSRKCPPESCGSVLGDSSSGSLCARFLAEQGSRLTDVISGSCSVWFGDVGACPLGAGLRPSKLRPPPYFLSIDCQQPSHRYMHL